MTAEEDPYIVKNLPPEDRELAEEIGRIAAAETDEVRAFATIRDARRDYHHNLRVQLGRRGYTMDRVHAFDYACSQAFRKERELRGRPTFPP